MSRLLTLLLLVVGVLSLTGCSAGGEADNPVTPQKMEQIAQGQDRAHFQPKGGTAPSAGGGAPSGSGAGAGTR